ncbi:MAG: class I SAM-dependent methyltransferase [Deltaproteobacteria bacterium]|nr:class I SAM-dependent methyltransferase [Deltaproteobacteria bacterium]
MKAATRQAIYAINLSFYRSKGAAEFDATRQYPWPGWNRLLSLLPFDMSDPSVLDIGCGNGRFALFLDEKWARPFRYLGVDVSQPLLKIARARSLDPKRFTFDAIDFLDPRFNSYLERDAFSLIVLFGVMHHVPDFEVRRGLLDTLTRRLSVDGRLAVTFWRFGADPRFRRKLVSWRAYNRDARETIDLDDLEEGDFLMRWGERKGDVRYCHFSNQEEIERLLGSLNARCTERFFSDGRGNCLNQYLLLRAAP